MVWSEDLHPDPYQNCTDPEHFYKYKNYSSSDRSKNKVLYLEFIHEVDLPLLGLHRTPHPHLRLLSSPLRLRPRMVKIVPYQSLWQRKRLYLDDYRAGIFKESMGTRNRGGIGLPYRPARLHRLAEFIPWNRFLGSINVLKIRAPVCWLYTCSQGCGSGSGLDPYSIGSVDPDPYSESGSGSRRAKMTHKSRQ